MDLLEIEGVPETADHHNNLQSFHLLICVCSIPICTWNLKLRTYSAPNHMTCSLSIKIYRSHGPFYEVPLYKTLIINPYIIIAIQTL